MLRDNIYIHPPSFLFLCLWECDISIEGRRPGHRTEYSAHVFNVKTSPAGSCSIFPQSTWALCPKRWDFLCIQVTGCKCSNSNRSNEIRIKEGVLQNYQPQLNNRIFSKVYYCSKTTGGDICVYPSISRGWIGGQFIGFLSYPSWTRQKGY